MRRGGSNLRAGRSLDAAHLLAVFRDVLHARDEGLVNSTDSGALGGLPQVVETADPRCIGRVLVAPANAVLESLSVLSSHVNSPLELMVAYYTIHVKCKGV